MKDMILVKRDTLSCLSAAAGVAAADLSSGLDDGTYEDDDLNGWSCEAVEAAIAEADAALEGSPALGDVETAAIDEAGAALEANPPSADGKEG